MNTSETFMDAFTEAGGTYCMDCGHCGLTLFTDQDEDVAALREKAKTQPHKYREVSDGSLAIGVLDGKRYIFGCPCDKGHKYELFIWAHREQITKYLKTRAKQEMEVAQRNLEAVT